MIKHGGQWHLFCAAVCQSFCKDPGLLNQELRGLLCAKLISEDFDKILVNSYWLVDENINILPVMLSMIVSDVDGDGHGHGGGGDDDG